MDRQTRWRWFVSLVLANGLPIMGWSAEPAKSSAKPAVVDAKAVRILDAGVIRTQFMSTGVGCPCPCPPSSSTPMTAPGASMPSISIPSAPSDPSRTPSAPSDPSNMPSTPNVSDLAQPSGTPSNFDLNANMSAASGNQNLAPNMIGDFFGPRVGNRGGAGTFVTNTVFHNFDSGINDFHQVNIVGNSATLGNQFFTTPAFPTSPQQPTPAGTVTGLFNGANVNGFTAVPTRQFVQVTEFSTPVLAQVFSIFDGSGHNGVLIDAPLPGYSIGRLRISENNSPIPRDRFFFNYNHFENVFGNLDVKRFTIGAEKTFLDGLTSLEVRIPFASTLDSYRDIGSSVTDTEFGNVGLNLKALLYNSETFALAGGTGIQTPTASDTKIFLDGVNVVRIENQSVHLLPYLGALYTPNDRWFAQGFIQMDFDANGDPTIINNAGVVRQFDLNSQTLLYVDAGIGYHIYNNPTMDGWINRITPMVELHWASSLQDGDFVTDGTFTVGDTSTNIDLLNVTLGTMLQVQQNTFVNLGYVLPVYSDRDKQFDWEFQAQVNIRYGRSAAGGAAGNAPFGL